MKLLGVIFCKDAAEMKRVESCLHERFQKYNTTNEWFELTSEIISYIEEFTNSGDDVLQVHHQNALHERSKRDGEYRQRPEVRQRKRERGREYSRRPEVRERQREYYKEYKQRPEVRQRRQEQREHRQEYYKEYIKRPEARQRKQERDREYRQRPEVRERQRARDRREYYRKRKAAKKKVASEQLSLF